MHVSLIPQPRTLTLQATVKALGNQMPGHPADIKIPASTDPWYLTSCGVRDALKARPPIEVVEPEVHLVPSEPGTVMKEYDPEAMKKALAAFAELAGLTEEPKVLTKEEALEAFASEVADFLGHRRSRNITISSSSAPRAKAPDICGRPVSSVLRYWGYQGATPAQCRAALIRINHPSAHLSTVHCQVAAGNAIRRGQTPKHPGKVMEVDEFLAEALAKILNG